MQIIFKFEKRSFFYASKEACNSPYEIAMASKTSSS